MNPLDLIKQYTIPIGAVLCFSAGLYSSHVWHGYQEGKRLKDIQDNIVSQGIVNRKVVEDLQAKYDDTQANFQFLKGKLNESKVTNTPCKLTPAAVGVWDHTVQLPKDTTGVIKETTSTDTPSVPVEGVEIKLIIENKLENDKIADDMRNQIEAIIKWDKDTYENIQ